ncbi:hypothetical protein DXA92_03195 [Agathobaculum butyriciproducens]|nr:hypothetical protein DXA94_00185 [Agathobaculum butyriciproducens]RGC62841.1 hypothetical protein DXA92_03195 [Agathobaculum butyriciproducens]RHR86775.1 hypothetical protein DWW41_07620 [Butyricicoccus sp. AF15-40]
MCKTDDLSYVNECVLCTK